ncbi:MAG: tetratricopeptide repeat protein [Candidatus Omnitrophota bacterium]|jgi:tetratricopeptide (TPR) repeat protein
MRLYFFKQSAEKVSIRVIPAKGPVRGGNEFCIKEDMLKKVKVVVLAQIFVALFLFNSCSFATGEENVKSLYGNYLRGLFYAEEGSYKDSLKELQKVKKLDPDSVYLRIKIASIYIRAGQFDKAESELKEAKRLNPDNFDVSLGLIFLYSYTQKDKQLEAEYKDFLERAHKLKPKDLRIAEYLAQLYFYEKNPQEAFKIYEEIVKERPDYVEGFFWLGLLNEEFKKHDDAIKMWKKALELDPDHAQTLNSLGYVYAEEGKNLDEAEKLIKKALVLEPDSGAYLDSLGWVYFKKKDYQKAEVYLKKAISYQEDPVIYEHLGDLYITLSNESEALNYYKKGLVRFPENVQLKEKISKYAKETENTKKQSK